MGADLRAGENRFADIGMSLTGVTLRKSAAGQMHQSK
jgi:hypothetical protein